MANPSTGSVINQNVANPREYNQQIAHYRHKRNDQNQTDRTVKMALLFQPSVISQSKLEVLAYAIAVAGFLFDFSHQILIIDKKKKKSEMAVCLDVQLGQAHCRKTRSHREW